MRFLLLIAVLLPSAPVLSASLDNVFLEHGVQPRDGHWVESLPSSVSPQPRLASKASWYGPGFAGSPTASGEPFNPSALTAAHRTLPFGTRVRVTNLNNGRSVVVRINDRGPFVGGRSIDLSRGAASAIGMISTGVAPVKTEVLR
jgi:rare lipoprotein A